MVFISSVINVYENFLNYLISLDPQGWGIVNISNDTDYRERFYIDDPDIKFFKTGYFEMEKFRKFISIAGQAISFFH